MKLSETTTKVLKNFASINPSILLKEGETIRTISPQKNVLAQAVTDEPITDEMCLYDINQFLNIAESIDDCVINVNASKAVLSNPQNTQNSTVFFADPSVIVTPPEKNINVPDPEVRFKLTQDTLSQVLKAGQVLGTPEIVVEGGPHPNDTLRIKAMDVNNDSTDTFHVNLPETSGTSFRFVFKTENFKMVPGDYDVEISSKGIARFSQSKLQYWIATESTSTYGG